MYIATVPVNFEGLLIFDSNNGSALEVVSSAVNFGIGSNVLFSNNTASRDGSALNLQESVITVKKKSNFTFRNNSACAGAAIQYHSINPHHFIYSKACFIKLLDDPPITANFLFENNIAKCPRFGNSIHASTLIPRDNEYKDTCRFNESVFNCVANFSFTGNVPEITTAGKKIVAEDGISIQAIPGIEVKLPIALHDELKNDIPGIYSMKVTKGNDIVHLDKAYSYITDRKGKFYGKPNAEAKVLIILARSPRNAVEVELPLILSQCPPGFVLESDTCKCSAFSINESMKYYRSLFCHDTSHQAMIYQNWWMNFDTNLQIGKFLDEDHLLYGYCPKDHCNNVESSRKLTFFENSTTVLNDELICHSSRNGRLCSQCRKQYTAHYHSSSYKCGSKGTCKWGWLLYLISELLPVTCVFLAIIVFNVKLSSGTFNGLIYFAQIIDKIVLDDASNYFSYYKFTEISFSGYALIIRMFNLNFFLLDSTSYCLWSNARNLDMITFRYVTTIYSLLLVAVIVVAAHYCNTKHFQGVFRKFRRHHLTAKSTLIHGISGFLILSYSRVTSTSIDLLLSASLYSKGHTVKYTVVYYNGELDYLSGKHLFYAIPAVLILISFGLIPPLLLIIYPLCYKILAFLKLSESKFSRILCTCIPLEKLKPLYDSFQSSFKDDFRFFSGMYFLFRLSTLAIQVIIPASGNITLFYATISILSVSVFVVHALCQPHKSKWHNFQEGILLFDIILIAMTFATVNIHDNETTGMGILLFQLALLYLPLLIIALPAGKIVWEKVKPLRSFRKRANEYCEYHEFSDSILFQESMNRS